MAGSLSFEKVADDYDQTRGGLERGRLTAADVAPYLLPGPVLEVGAGTGAVAVALAERGFPVCGVDISPAMLSRAHQRVGGVVAVADACALPVRSQSVPNVLFAHVLHLVSDLRLALAEAARVLASGGRLVAVHGHLEADRDDVIDAIEPLGVLQQRADTPAGLAAACGDLGLRVVTQCRAGRHERDTSPDEFAAGLAARAWPYLWAVDDDTWRSVVEPVIAALRRLPGPDRPRHQVWRASLSVFGREPR
jgi:SAM-dependent methyltransferase